MNRTDQERTFANDLLRISRAYRREVDRGLAAHDLSEARALPVLYIARLGEGVRQGVLADALGIEGPSLVRLLDQLNASGLVERREDAGDARGRTLHLTPAGRALAALIEPALDKFRADYLAGVTDKDLAAALRVFAAFGRALDARQARPKGPGA